MTTITLTEADRTTDTWERKGWQAIRYNDAGEPVERYRLPDDAIKIAEPEKPPGMVLMKNADYQSWCFCINNKLAFFYDKMSAYPLKNCTIVDNPHNDPTLAAAIRAAQEGK